MNAPAPAPAPAAVLAAAVERARPLAAAAARARTNRFDQSRGRYPVTVGGYVIGYAERFALATSKTAVWWAAEDADGNRVAAGLERRADAVEVLGATDGAVEAYRAAARNGAFGYPEGEQVAAEDAALAAALEVADAQAEQAAYNPAPLVNCGTCEAIAGFTCYPGCPGAAERIAAERYDRAESDALRGVKWVDGCPLPGEMCDPDVDHDHDPISDAMITNAATADERAEEAQDAALIAAYHPDRSTA